VRGIHLHALVFMVWNMYKLVELIYLGFLFTKDKSILEVVRLIFDHQIVAAFVGK
jgi:hypothetical protein